LRRHCQQNAVFRAALVNEVDDFISCPRAVRWIGNTELQFHLDCRSIDRLQGNDRRGLPHDAPAGPEDSFHHVLDDIWFMNRGDTHG
jgi:hypothetical protein